jgi:protein-disulfide isomerase
VNNFKPFRYAFYAFAVLATAFVYVSINHTQSHAENSSATNMNEKELGDFIYNYIMENPGIIIEAVEKFQKNEAAEEAKLYEKKLSENKDTLFNNTTSPSVGNPNADVTIVEFFDYNCGYCKKALEDIQTLLKEDDNIKVIFKDMPILTPSSKLASLWSLAAEKQGKYFEFHVAVMEHSGNKSESTLKKIAEKLGLDVEKLQADAQDPALEKVLNDNLRLSQELGIRGTPSFIINDTLARGYVGIDRLKETIKSKRSENKG